MYLPLIVVVPEETKQITMKLIHIVYKTKEYENPIWSDEQILKPGGHFKTFHLQTSLAGQYKLFCQIPGERNIKVSNFDSWYLGILTCSNDILNDAIYSSNYQLC